MYSTKYEIPGDVQVEVKGREVVVTGDGKENRRTFKAKHVEIKKDGNLIEVFTPSRKKSDRADVGTVMGHIRNMVVGIEKGVTYKLKVIYSHFPMTAKVEGNTFSVENFLGEKKPRTLKLVDGAQVEVKGQEITVTGFNKSSGAISTVSSFRAIELLWILSANAPSK